jgi:hypothetical protein
MVDTAETVVASAPTATPDPEDTPIRLTWPSRRRGRRWPHVGPARHLGALAAPLLLYALAALFFAPPLLFLAAGVWSAVAYTRTLLSLLHLVGDWQFSTFFDRLAAARLAARVALASGAYFVLLFALIVLFAGLLGRRWRRLFLLPGLLLTLPAVVLFLAGVEAGAEGIAGRFGLPPSLAGPFLTLYALLDALLLAAFLTDPRPHRRRRPRLRKHPSDERATTPLPIVRFGPPLPLPPAEAPAEPARAADAATGAPLPDHASEAAQAVSPAALHGAPAELARADA